MTAPTPDIQHTGIVLLGDCNPKIFQPAWFAAEGLIGKQQAEEATIEVVHPHIVVFSLDQLRLQIDRDRFTVETTEEPYERVRDLVSGTFRLLRHTPLRMMGINKRMHFKIPSEDRWHAFGHKLAPKDPWKGILEKPGMRSLTMEQSSRPDELKGYIRVKVEPSAKVHPGIYFDVNDHYEVEEPDAAIGCDEIMGILDQVWDEAQDRANKIIFSLLEKQ